MGEANAERMLGVEGWVPTAEEARAAGFPIQDIVAGDNAAVVARAHELVEAQIATGGRSVDAAEVARRLKVNADESAMLVSNAVMSPRFLLAMRDFNQRKPSIARFFASRTRRSALEARRHHAGLRRLSERGGARACDKRFYRV